MLHGGPGQEKHRENVCPKCSFELLLRDFLDRFLRMLFGRVVDYDVDLAELIESFIYDFVAKLRVANIAINQKTLPSLLLDQLRRFSGVLVLL